MPAWVSCWKPDSGSQMVALTASDESLLAEIMGTIIPETDTPGAKSLQVHQFALRMIHDCYDDEALASLKNGLVQADKLAQKELNKSFVGSEAKEREQVLVRMSVSEDPETKKSYDLIKGLTVRGYLNSEYVMVNVLNYTMAPGFYNGCVPVESVA
ncbi:gluconate 2-dehydrogenase subunit 3 family protein [soil metagenome]